MQGRRTSICIPGKPGGGAPGGKGGGGGPGSLPMGENAGLGPVCVFVYVHKLMCEFELCVYL